MALRDFFWLGALFASDALPAPNLRSDRVPPLRSPELPYSVSQHMRRFFENVPEDSTDEPGEVSYVND